MAPPLTSLWNFSQTATVISFPQHSFCPAPKFVWKRMERVTGRLSTSFDHLNYRIYGFQVRGLHKPKLFTSGNKVEDCRIAMDLEQSQLRKHTEIQQEEFLNLLPLSPPISFHDSLAANAIVVAFFFVYFNAVFALVASQRRSACTLCLHDLSAFLDHKFLCFPT
eukprot:Gb_05484 [translate_table: standard]